MHTPTSPIQSRIIMDIVLFFSVLYAPWWVVVFAVLSCLIYFKNFYEAFFVGFLFDMLYGANLSIAHGFRFFFSSVSLLFIVAAEFVKGKIRT